MSYSIIRVQKMNRQAIKGIQYHNQREKESQSNPDIRKEDAHLNYDLIHGQDRIDYTEKIEQTISENVKSSRKIRKDAVLVSEFLITSDSAFFDKLSPEEQKRYFETTKDFLADRYGKENLVYATVHNDERTPHMHVGIVPVTFDGRLSAKEVVGNKMQLVKLQDAFNGHVRSQGYDLERGVSSDRKHLDMVQYKTLTARERAQEASVSYEQALDRVQAIEGRTKALEDIQGKQMMGRVMLKQDDYQALVDFSTKGALAELDAEHLRSELENAKQEVQTVRKEMQDGQDKLRKHYQGVERRDEDTKARLDELAEQKATQRAQQFVKENNVVGQYNNLVDKYNKIVEQNQELEGTAKGLQDTVRTQEYEIKSYRREITVLQAHNEDLTKENATLRDKIGEIKAEFEAWKDRQRIVLHNLLKEIQDRLRKQRVAPAHTHFLTEEKDKMVENTLKDMEKPEKTLKKEQDKGMEMEL